MGEQSIARRTWWIAGSAAALVAVVAVVWLLLPPRPAQTAPPPAPVFTTAVPEPAVSVEAEPTPTGFPVNATAYDLSALPEANVFAVIAALPVDDDPFAGFTGEMVRSAAEAAPIFADPLGEPVARLPREYVYDGTTVPVIERDQNWVRVLLSGRQATPSSGNSAQVTGWLRATDVEVAATDVAVEVSISARTVDIVRAGVAERVATDFGWGRSDTPTPVGRTFIMTTRVEPSYGYTRGHPIVYFGVQSPTLDGFGGASVAITAFHYHDERSGSISNGCLRLDGAAIDTLAQLPLGTPVIVRP